MERTYLELSKEAGSEHKFYEVTLDGAELTIRYGRIGTDGQTQRKTLDSPEKARAEADKKLREKRRAGYEEATPGVRQKRTVTRRSVAEVRPSGGTKRAPVLWRYRSGSAAFGIAVDDKRCWIGNQGGQISALDFDGEVQASFQLPDGVKCIVSDGTWLYAGCDDGNVYDLSGKLPFVAYEIDSRVDLYWLDIAGGMLGVSDASGNVYTFDADNEARWANVASSGRAGWMVRVDDRGVYHGHSGGLAMYDRESGMPLWEARTKGAVLFGWQEGDDLYAATSHNLVQRFGKDGSHKSDYACDATVYSCATSPGGEYVFAGDYASALYCFDRQGTRLWKLATGCGSALSMGYRAERLYIVTTDGSLASVDASEAAILAAQGGVVPEVRDVKARAVDHATPITALRVTDDASGVVLECVSEGGKLRVRPVTPGFRAGWHVQFPRNLREAGARYVVGGLAEANGFYRVTGRIERLAS